MLMSLEKLVKEQECSLCMKAKDGAVCSDEQGQSVLCWGCLKKMANRKMRLAESKIPAAAPAARPVNGPAMAVPVK